MYIWEDAQLFIRRNWQRGSVYIRDGRIVAIAERPQSDWFGPRRRLDGAYVVPGFIDVHIHGVDGVDALDATPEAYERMAIALRRHGVTGFLPTLGSAAREVYDAALASCRPLVSDGARLLGLHLEGPYLHPERAGAQPREALRPPDPAEYRPWLSHPLVKMITVAPELSGAEALIREAHALGIHVALGHSTADARQTRRAADWGVRGITHLFNALAPLHHRTPGACEAALDDKRLMLQLIADGIHVHPIWIRLVFRLAQHRTVLISDAVRAAGLSSGIATFAGQRIEVHGGAAYLADGTLAGSATLLDGALRLMVREVGFPLEDVLPLLTEHPARLLGLSRRYGRIAVGSMADLTVLDPQSLDVIYCERAST